MGGKHFAGVFLLAMIFAVTLQDSCISFNRYDVAQVWKIKANSTACSLIPHLPDQDDRYTLKSVGENLLVESQNFSINFDANWITEKVNYDYSVSIKRKGLKNPHFMTLEPTEDKKLVNTYEFHQADDDKFFRRTIYYIHKDDISRDGRASYIVMLAFLCSVFGVFVILSVTSRVMNFGLTFMSVLLVGLSLCMGMWIIPYTMGFVLLLTSIVVVAGILGVINWKFFHSIGSICFGFAAVVYFIVGTSIEYKYGYPVAAFALACSSGVFAWRIPGMVMLAKLKFFGLHFFFWLVQYTFWAHIFIIYPAEIYIRMRMGDWYYPLGRPGKGATHYLPMIEAGIGALVFSILSGAIANSRFQKTGYGPDSGTEEYMPLI